MSGGFNAPIMETLVTVHSLYRWFVLAVVVATVVVGWRRYRAETPWGEGSDRPYALAAVLFDLQVALGIILYLGKQAWTHNLFIAAIHPIGALIAVALFHIGVSRARKQASAASHRTVAIFALLALLLLVMAIPWAR